MADQDASVSTSTGQEPEMTEPPPVATPTRSHADNEAHVPRYMPIPAVTRWLNNGRDPSPCSSPGESENYLLSSSPPLSAGFASATHDEVESRSLSSAEHSQLRKDSDDAKHKVVKQRSFSVASASVEVENLPDLNMIGAQRTKQLDRSEKEGDTKQDRNAREEFSLARASIKREPDGEELASRLSDLDISSGSTSSSLGIRSHPHPGYSCKDGSLTSFLPSSAGASQRSGSGNWGLGNAGWPSEVQQSFPQEEQDTPGAEDEQRRFSCPFSKHDPHRYEHIPTCAPLLGLKDMKRVR